MDNILIMFGYCWMVVAALIGLLLAKRHETTLADLERIAAAGDLAEYHRVNDGYKWNKTVHAHSFLFSTVAVTVGLAMSRMNYAVEVRDGMAIALMAAAVVWTIGGLRSSKPLMAVGDITLLVSIAMSAIGLAKAL